MSSICLVVWWCAPDGSRLQAQEEGLIGHWKLGVDGSDSSGNGNDAQNHGVEFADGAAVFDGIGDFLEVKPRASLKLGTGDFSVSLWVHTEDALDDVLGDLVTKYDPVTRTGFGLSLIHHAGVTGSQANYRNLHFGIDDGMTSTKDWRDEGRPGGAIFVHCMAVHDGGLYAGTVEGRTNNDRGHVYRYVDTGEWEDLGAPWKSNGVSSMASFEGKLYVGVSRVLLHYSGLEPTLSHHIGGKVFRYDDEAKEEDGAGGKWTEVGQLPGLDGVNGLVTFGGRLYATGFYQPGFFRYEGGTAWTPMGSPEGPEGEDPMRTEALCVFNGSIYATGYDEGAVYRFDGEKWIRTGLLGTATRTQAYWNGTKWIPTGLDGDETGTQVYSLSVYQGKLHAGTWPEGKVYRYEGDDNWVSTGRLGEEQEIMGATVYNGKLYAGSLPMGEIFRYDGDEKWRSVGRVDFTEDVIYRRAYSMAVYRGRLFSGTFPSGRVRSFEAGKMVTWDRELPSGWRHIVAVKAGGALKLFVDGKQVAESDGEFAAKDFDLNNEAPLRIGFGQHDYFRGKMKDVRLYRRALDPERLR